jgi:hypothetical protein
MTGIAIIGTIVSAVAVYQSTRWSASERPASEPRPRGEAPRKRLD